jgi:hypothetical protein
MSIAIDHAWLCCCWFRMLEDATAAARRVCDKVRRGSATRVTLGAKALLLTFIRGLLLPAALVLSSETASGHAPVHMLTSYNKSSGRVRDGLNPLTSCRWLCLLAHNPLPACCRRSLPGGSSNDHFLLQRSHSLHSLNSFIHSLHGNPCPSSSKLCFGLYAPVSFTLARLGRGFDPCSLRFVGRSADDLGQSLLQHDGLWRPPSFEKSLNIDTDASRSNRSGYQNKNNELCCVHC